MAKNWTEEEEEFIRANFLTQTYGELAEHFGVTTKAMESKIRRMGLKKQELLAEAAEAGELEPSAAAAETGMAEEQHPAPIESIHALPRRTEVRQETAAEKQQRLQATRAAAEMEKARREELRSAKPVVSALEKFESGLKKLQAGKRAQAAADFEAILADPPADLGLVTRVRQYLLAAQAKDETKPKLSSAEDLYHHGVELLNAGDLQGAIETLTKALSPRRPRLAGTVPSPGP